MKFVSSSESIIDWFLQRFFFFFVFLLSCTSLCSQEASVQATINPIEIMIGEQAKVEVKAMMKEGSESVFPVFKPNQEIIPGVEVIDSKDGGVHNAENGYVERTVTYTITSFDDTLYYLPPFEVKIGGKAFKSKSLALKVLTLDVDTLHPENFFGPKDVQSNPFLWSEWKTPFWLSVLLLLIMVVCYYLYLRLRDNKPIIKSISFVKRILPHQRAINEIEELRSGHRLSDDNQEELKNYYTKLTEALRKYIEERYGFSAMEMTSSEIIEQLMKSADSKSLDELRHVFQTADLVKFAKYSTFINENDANLVTAIEFINETKREDVQSVEIVQPKYTEEEQKTKKERVILKTIVISLLIASILLLCYILYSLGALID